jgi:hypothetical protein
MAKPKKEVVTNLVRHTAETMNNELCILSSLVNKSIKNDTVNSSDLEEMKSSCLRCTKATATLLECSR